MVISDQTSIDRLSTSPCEDSVHEISQACPTSPLETSPLSSPLPSPASGPRSREPSREFFASRESFASEESLTRTTPPHSVPGSPRSSIDAHSPVQQFVNALDTHPRESQTFPAISPTTSNATSESIDAATCIICMDQPKDIVLAPCQHSHCCLACFQRTQLNACPICRATVRSVILQSTSLELPVSLVLQKPVHVRQDAAQAPVTLDDPELREAVTYETPLPLVSRRSAPVIPSYLRDEVASVQSRTTSVSSVSVARQAESSVRPRRRSQEAAFRRLRETGTVHTPSEPSCQRSDTLERRHTLSTSLRTVSPDPRVAHASPRASPLREYENIVLLGHDRKLMMKLAQKLIAAFPPPVNTGAQSHLRDRSTFVVNGKALRLVIIECDPYNSGPGLALRVQRQSPKLVLMCADFFNVSSFESIVRLDMEVLDYLNLPCTWALIKSLLMKRPRQSHSVEDADVRTAKHFLSSRRRCFLVTVDVAQETTTMRKLGYYLYKAAYKGSSAIGGGSLLSDEQLVSPRKLWSCWCLRMDQPQKQNRLRYRFRQLFTNFAIWRR